MSEAEYFPIAARHSGDCPHCANGIQPGEAIVKRAVDDDYSHHGCAVFADELDQDAAAAKRRELELWRDKQGRLRRPRPRKRKARRRSSVRGGV